MDAKKNQTHKLGNNRRVRQKKNRTHNAHSLAREFLANGRWVYWNGLYFQYDGTKYREVRWKEVRALLNRHARGLLDEEYRQQVRRHRQAMRAGAPSRPPAPREVTTALVGNVLGALEGETLRPGHLPLPGWLDGEAGGNVLALTNGILDLDAAELRPHTPDWFSLVCVPYAYDPEATCPRWLSVLNQNLEGDHDRIALLQEFFGYTLFSSTDAQRFLFLVGEGANGKSVVLAGLHAMLGPDNVSTLPLEDFGVRFALAHTLGKLANISPEVGELDKTAEGTLKAYTSGDRITFEKKQNDRFSAWPTARLVLSTNNLPRFSDKTDGVWRRLLVVPFNRQVPVGERVAGMDKPGFWMREGEAPGILNWALEGMRRLKANGMKFTESAVCRRALETHRLESDPCRVFLLENYVGDEKAPPVRADEVYQAYRRWCEGNGHKAVLTAQNFARQVRRVLGLAEPRPHRFGKVGVKRAWFGLAPLHSEGVTTVTLCNALPGESVTPHPLPAA